MYVPSTRMPVFFGKKAFKNTKYQKVCIYCTYLVLFSCFFFLQENNCLFETDVLLVAKIRHEAGHGRLKNVVSLCKYISCHMLLRMVVLIDCL